jgi:8-oxo-dGTP pyrophosphatase MutT (NUDIX family)
VTKFFKPVIPSFEATDRDMMGDVCPDLKPIQTLHENNWFSVRNRGGFYTVELKTPQVMVLPIIENHSVMMVRVKRPVRGVPTFELPAGAVESGEKLVEAAARELKQETGIAVEDFSRFHPLIPLSVQPTRDPRLLSIFQIDLTENEFEARLPHDHEIDSVLCLKFQEFCDRFVAGEIYVSTPPAIILRYLLEKKKLKLF